MIKYQTLKKHLYVDFNNYLAVIVLTVNPVSNDHPRYPLIVAVVDRRSLFKGTLMLKT
jgi:hypothetical protein